jgi:DNA primase
MFLDFNEIKQTHPIDQVAERLNLKLKKSGAQLRGPSWTGEGDERALVITPAKAVFYNFATQEGGDAIKLVSLVKGLPPKEAAAWIANAEPEKKKPEAERGFRRLDYLEVNHEAVQALGFDAEDAEKLGIGFAPRGVLRGKVAVPIRLEDGTLTGYIGITDCQLPPKWSWADD